MYISDIRDVTKSHTRKLTIQIYSMTVLTPPICFSILVWFGKHTELCVDRFWREVGTINNYGWNRED